MLFNVKTKYANLDKLSLLDTRKYFFFSYFQKIQARESAKLQTKIIRGITYIRSVFINK